MSLLSDLLNHLQPNVAGAGKPPMEKLATDRPRLVLVKAVQLPPSQFTSAASATTGWRQARDQYVNHIMTCRSCYAPGGRYCTTGAGLRAVYDNTPMEVPLDR